MPTPAAFFSLRTVPNTGSVGLWVCPTSARSVPFQELQQLPYQLQLTTALFQFPIWGEQAEVLTAPKLPWRPPLSPPQPPACCWPHAGLWGCLHPCVPMPSIALRGLSAPRSWQQGPTTQCLHPAVPRSLLFKLSVSAPCPMRACNLAGFSPAPGAAFFYSHGLLYSQEITGFSFVLIKIQSRRRGSCCSLISSSLPRTAPCSRRSPLGTRGGVSALSLHGDGGRRCATPKPRAATRSALSQSHRWISTCHSHARPSPAVHPMGWVGSGLDLFLFKIIFKAGQPRRDGIAAFVCVRGMLLGKRGGRGAGGADLISRAAQPPYK